jgi:hypothetical protein
MVKNSIENFILIVGSLKKKRERKMKKIMKRKKVGIMLSMITIGILTLTGCDSNNDEDTIQGNLIDSGVQGIHYETSSNINGITGPNGSFDYKDGDTITFTLGKINLGTSLPATDGLITPKSLISGNNQPTENQQNQINLMLQTLQSLDLDNNPDNGIQITQNIIDKCNKLDTNLNFNELNESQLIDIDNKLNLGIDENFDGKLDVDLNTALTHFEKSLDNWEDFKSKLDDAKNKINDALDNKLDDTKNTTNDDKLDVVYDLKDLPITKDITSIIKSNLYSLDQYNKLNNDLLFTIYDYQNNNNDVQIPELKNIYYKSQNNITNIYHNLLDRYDFDTIDFDKDSIGNYNNNDDDDNDLNELFTQFKSFAIDGIDNSLITSCALQVLSINTIDDYINQINESNDDAIDIIATLNEFKKDYFNYYWTFDKLLKDNGITNGCFIENDDSKFADNELIYNLLKDNKNNIYPNQNE